jgi:hypothetical protein
MEDGDVFCFNEEESNTLPLSLITSGMHDGAGPFPAMKKQFSEGDLDSRPAAGFPAHLLGSPGAVLPPAPVSQDRLHRLQPVQLLSLPFIPATDESGKSDCGGISATSTVSSDLLTIPFATVGGRDAQRMPGILPRAMTPAAIRAGRDPGGLTPSAAKQLRRGADGPAPEAKLPSEEVKAQRARRNRESAKRSRLKTKLMHQVMSETFERLKDENRALREVVDNLLANCKTAPPDVQEKLGDILRGSGDPEGSLLRP